MLRGEGSHILPVLLLKLLIRQPLVPAVELLTLVLMLASELMLVGEDCWMCRH